MNLSVAKRFVSGFMCHINGLTAKYIFLWHGGNSYNILTSWAVCLEIMDQWPVLSHRELLYSKSRAEKVEFHG